VGGSWFSASWTWVWKATKQTCFWWDKEEIKFQQKYEKRSFPNLIIFLLAELRQRLSFHEDWDDQFTRIPTLKVGYDDHGYNDHGYNDFMVLTNQNLVIFWFLIAALLRKPSVMMLSLLCTSKYWWFRRVHYI